MTTALGELSTSLSSFALGGVCLSIDLTEEGGGVCGRRTEATVMATVGRVGVANVRGEATAVEEEGSAELEGGLSVESKNDEDCCRLNVADEQPFIFRPSFSAICTEVGVEIADWLCEGDEAALSCFGSTLSFCSKNVNVLVADFGVTESGESDRPCDGEAFKTC